DCRALARVVHPAPRHLPAAFSADGKLLATLTEAGRVHVWEIATGRQRLEFVARNRQGASTPAAFLPGDKTLAAWDGAGLSIRDLTTGKELRHDRLTAAETASFSPDGGRFAVQAGARSLRLQPTDGGKPVLVRLPNDAPQCP